MKKIGLFRPYMSWRARFYAIRTLMGTMIGEGPVVKQFENEFADKFGFQRGRCLAVNSGTTALELSYYLAGIKEGDEVITTILTCTATNLPLVHLGAKIIFADIEPDLNISVEDVKKKITTKTKAIVFVHFGGNNRGLEELAHLCWEKQIVLIEDAAQAVGSERWGIANFTAVSFQAIKTLTSVDGGMLICKNPGDYFRAKKLRWYGYDREMKQKNGDTDIVEAGWKYHMNDVIASIGLGNLRSFKKPLQHRKKLAKIYAEYGIQAYAWLAVGTLSFQTDMAAFRLHMAENGVEVGQHHFRNDKYEVFKQFKTEVPNMDNMETAYVFFPYHTGVSPRMAHKIGKLYLKYK